MNIIGIFVPKLISLLMIGVSSVEIRGKVMLLAIWFLKLILDYDAAKPGHRGAIYGFARKIKGEIDELLVGLIQLIPAVVFLVITIRIKAWLLLIPGVIKAADHTIFIFYCINDIFAGRRRRKNAGSNCK